VSQSLALRCQILSCTSQPIEDEGWFYHSDGLIWVVDGLIKRVGNYYDVKHHLPDDLIVEHRPEHLLIPGFVDTHVHYPQLEMIGAYGTQLLDWLNRYTFPVELKYRDLDYASQQAEFFLDQLMANGTTTALVFATSSVNSVDAFFTESLRRNLRMVSGKVLMDRHAPNPLCDTAQSAYDDSSALIDKWRSQGRLGYAVTPRFAPTSTDAQLAVAGALIKENSDAYLHTHISENVDEIAWVGELFPDHQGYLDTYDHFGLVTDRSVFAHGIHLSDAEMKRLHDCGSAVCHCPSSNLFLGSGLFPFKRLKQAGVNVTMGTDVGGGTSLSMLSTQGDAYKIQQMAGNVLRPLEAFYMATLAGAKALGLDDRIGALVEGYEADMVLLDLASTPVIEARMKRADHIEDRLFALSILGDDRSVAQTYIMGKPAL
jgi:guanine deaminase